MNKKNWVYLSIITILSIYSCIKCKEDVYIGDKKISSSTINNWFPYHNQEKLVFVNQSNDSITYTRTQYDSIYIEKTSRYLCSRGKSNRTLERFSSQQKTIKFQSPNNNEIVILSSVEGNYNDETPLFDKISYSRNNSNEVIVGIDRNNPNNTEFSTLHQFFNTVQLNGKNYNNIYTEIYTGENKEPGTQNLYIQQGVGLLAYKDSKGEIWIVVKENE